MKYFAVSPSDLRVADVLVTTGAAATSAGIRTATGCDFSHAMLFIGDGSIIEAIGTGVTEHSLEVATADVTLALVLRRRGMSAKHQGDVVTHARTFVGRDYDTVGAVGAGVSHKRGKALAWGGFLLSPIGYGLSALAVRQNASDAKKDEKFFCSELVARAYEMAGVPLTDGSPSFTTPRAIRTSSVLEYAGHLIGGPVSRP